MPSTRVSLSYHMVFSTKNREPLIVPELRERVYQYLGGCIRTAGGVSLEIGGVTDHVHILAGLNATHCVADVLRDIKRATSLWVHDEIGLHEFAWQEGYGAFSVSSNDTGGLVDYIRRQEEHHRHVTSRKSTDNSWRTTGSNSTSATSGRRIDCAGRPRSVQHPCRGAVLGVVRIPVESLRSATGYSPTRLRRAERFGGYSALACSGGSVCRGASSRLALRTA